MSKAKGKGKDYISGLPDELLHHILSLLPSTIEAIRTCVLSKRWRLVWTHVPNLIFPIEEFSDSSREDIISCIDKTLTLHSAPKVEKVFLEHDDYMEGDLLGLRLDSWLLFAVEREVKDLTLILCTEIVEEVGYYSDGYCLPQFFYHNSSLVKLSTKFCRFTPKGRVSWESLKDLSIVMMELTDELIENILHGTPLLHSLELSNCCGFSRIDLSHNTHLKTLVIEHFAYDGGSLFKVSCPYLENLKFLGTWDDMNVEFINMTSFVRVTLDFEVTTYQNYSEGHCQNIVKKLLQNVSHTKQLTLGNWCVQLLSSWTESVMPSLSSTRKYLILNISRLDFEWIHGIKKLLLSSHELEKLVINFGYNHNQYLSDTFQDFSWSPYGEAFSCLEYHLKTVEITGFDKGACSHAYGYYFFMFLFAKSKVLQSRVIFRSKKKVVIFDLGEETNAMLQVAKQLLSFPRVSSSAEVRLDE